MKKAARLSAFNLDRKALSISRRGAWGQVAIASLLITVLPSLLLAWGWNCQLNGFALPPVAIWSAGFGGVMVITLGYALLFKYPVSIVRLRSYLKTLANGEIPELVPLSDDEDDLAAVQRYMEGIVKIAEDRIRMLQSKYEVELEAERQRVMVESIGSMCHHLGQPATVMNMCLYRMRNNPGPGDVPLILDECATAFNAMTEILDKLRNIAYYQSEPYLSQAVDTPKKIEDRIINIEG